MTRSPTRRLVVVRSSSPAGEASAAMWGFASASGESAGSSAVQPTNKVTALSTKARVNKRRLSLDSWRSRGARWFDRGTTVGCSSKTKDAATRRVFRTPDEPFCTRGVATNRNPRTSLLLVCVFGLMTPTRGCRVGSLSASHYSAVRPRGLVKGGNDGRLRLATRAQWWRLFAAGVAFDHTTTLGLPRGSGAKIEHTAHAAQNTQFQRMCPGARTHLRAPAEIPVPKRLTRTDEVRVRANPN